MSNSGNLFRGPAVWTLIAGVAIGAGAMYSTFSPRPGTLAITQPYVAAPHPVAITKSGSMAALKELDSAFATLADYAAPAVVKIVSQSGPSQGLSGMVPAHGGEGSGVIFRPDGYIVTNDHVVGGFDKVTVLLHDGRQLVGKVTRAEDSDIAVVKIDAKNLPTIPFGDSSKVRPGQFAMAIGSPFGFESSVTIGHVSALNRHNQIPDPMSGLVRVYPELIQTDASINMGNSGGPLIDVDGEVIGINSSILSPTGGAVGVGFAITSNQARLIAEMLIEKGKVTRAFMGVVPDNLKDFQKSKLNLTTGALVSDVASNSPAEIAGIKKDDVIVRIGNIQVNDQMDLRNSMLKYAPGSTIDVELIRDGRHKTVNVKLLDAPKHLLQQQSTPVQSNPQTPFGDNGKMPDVDQFMKQFKNQIPQGNGNRQFGPARLGVQIATIDETLRKQFHLPPSAKGAVVVAVMPDSVADHAKIAPGDLITRIGTKEIASADDIKSAMKGVNWGDRVHIKFSRFGANSAYNQEQDLTFK